MIPLRSGSSASAERKNSCTSSSTASSSTYHSGKTLLSRSAPPRRHLTHSASVHHKMVPQSKSHVRPSKSVMLPAGSMGPMSTTVAQVHWSDDRDSLLAASSNFRGHHLPRMKRSVHRQSYHWEDSRCPQTQYDVQHHYQQQQHHQQVQLRSSRLLSHLAKSEGVLYGPCSLPTGFMDPAAATGGIPRAPIQPPAKGRKGRRRKSPSPAAGSVMHYEVLPCHQKSRGGSVMRISDSDQDAVCRDV
jgi:hypothetical protein